MSYHSLDLDSTSSDYLDLKRKPGRTKKHEKKKVTIDSFRISNSTTSSTTLSPLTDTSYDSGPSKVEAKKVISVYRTKDFSDKTESVTVSNIPVQQQPNSIIQSLDTTLNVLNPYNEALAPNAYSVTQLLGSDDSMYSSIVNNKAPSHDIGESSKNVKNDQSQSGAEVKHIYNHHTRRLSENEAVQTAGGNIHQHQKELEHWEYETPLSSYWYISAPEDPKMALISLLVETHRRIIGCREHPNLNFRNNVDYGLSSLQVNYDIDPECCGCIWPFVAAEESPENLKDEHGNRKYYFLTAESQGFDWEEQDFSAPLSYLMERRKKLKDLVLMMKEELFYITERFLDLSKKFRHKIVRDSRLRKRFEAVGLDLVYKRAHLDNMHHLYHRVKKLYEAYLPLCHEA